MMKVKSCDYMSEGSSLTTNKKFTDFLYITKISSTMTLAKDLIKKCSNLILIAGTQTQGRGRYNRSWTSPKGGLWFSLLQKIKIKPSLLPFVSLAMALSVAESLADLGVETYIKWPNDVMIKDKKICGILVDAKFLHNETLQVVIGVGINVNFPSEIFSGSLREKAITLLDILGYEIDLIALLDDLTEKYYSYLREIQQNNIRLVLEKINSRLYGKGEKVIAYTKKGCFKGFLSRISNKGDLILYDGEVEYFIDYTIIEKLVKL